MANFLNHDSAPLEAELQAVIAGAEPEMAGQGAGKRLCAAHGGPLLQTLKEGEDTDMNDKGKALESLGGSGRQSDLCHAGESNTH